MNTYKCDAKYNMVRIAQWKQEVVTLEAYWTMQDKAFPRTWWAFPNTQSTTNSEVTHFIWRYFVVWASCMGVSYPVPEVAMDFHRYLQASQLI